MASCVTGCMDGMEVNSKSSDRVKEARESVTEFLLINHPLDCPVCDQAGECDLQDLSFEHGKGKSRFIEDKRTLNLKICQIFNYI
jgi:NADH-quinone oxidoreductase subunit G